MPALKLTEAEANAECAVKFFDYRYVRNYAGSKVQVLADRKTWHGVNGTFLSETPFTGLEVTRVAPDYCSDHAATAMLLDKLAERCSLVRIQWYRTHEPWTCEAHLTGGPVVEARATTEGHAVVICALKSVGVEAEISE